MSDTPTTQPTAADEVLRADGLGKVYPARGSSWAPASRALQAADLAVRPGEFVVIIGRSGAGKSTLLRCLNLLVRPTEGRVLLRGEDVTRASGGRLRRVRQRVGMIFQQFNLVRRLSVLENVLTGRLRFCRDPISSTMAMARVFRAADRSMAMECLSRVGMAEKARQRADALSGGQQQRVAIARVLAQDPEVVLADEPIASLDPVSAAGVMDLLRDIQRTRRIPVVVNLHQVEVARQYATRIVGMAAGRIVFDGPPSRLSDAAVDAIYTPTTVPAEPPLTAARGSSPRAEPLAA